MAGAPNKAGQITRVCDEAHRAKVRIRVECQKEATHAASKAEKRYCAHTADLHNASPGLGKRETLNE